MIGGQLAEFKQLLITEGNCALSKAATAVDRDYGYVNFYWIEIIFHLIK